MIVNSAIQDLRRREDIHKQQQLSKYYQIRRKQPVIPKMADLPPARLRLLKHPFYSMDHSKSRLADNVKRGITFKSLTIHKIHLHLLTSIDTDSFLMALRRFVSHCGTSSELYSDHDTNSHGGQRELQETFDHSLDQAIFS